MSEMEAAYGVKEGAIEVDMMFLKIMLSHQILHHSGFYLRTLFDIHLCHVSI